MLHSGIPFDGSGQEGECDGVVSAQRKLAESQEPKPLSRVSGSHSCFSPWGHVNWQIVACTGILQLYPQLFMGGSEVGVVFLSRMAPLRAGAAWSSRWEKSPDHCTRNSGSSPSLPFPPSSCFYGLSTRDGDWTSGGSRPRGQL